MQEDPPQYLRLHPPVPACTRLYCACTAPVLRPEFAPSGGDHLGLAA